MLRHGFARLGLSLVLLLAAPAIAAPQVVTLGGDATTDSDPVAACGALAASPFEAGWSGRGLADKQIFLDGAQTACDAALAASPDSTEAKAWLGRVYILVGRATDAVPLLDTAAAAANPLAAYLLSGLLGGEVANGVDSDDARAASLLQQASDAGFAPAEADLAERYENGTGVTQDFAEALRLYRLAADQGHGHAAYMVGVSHQYAQGTDVDYDKAQTAFQRAIDLGEAAGWYGVGQMHELGQGVTQDYAKAAEAYQHGADEGEKMSETSLAYLLGQGLGVTQDFAKSFALLRDAADQQYGLAQANLAIAYLFGQGTSVDAGTAFSLALAANGKQVAFAAGIVGYMYAEGLGTERDLTQALQYFQQGAQAGDQYSTDRIPVTEAELACADQAGSQYEPSGRGLDFAAIDAEAAITACESALQQNPASVGDKVWLARAYARAERYGDALPLLLEGVDAKNVLAETLYADLLLNGTGVDQDTGRALELYKLAADANFSLAELTLGQLYADGGAVTADLNTAIEWFRKASQNGISEADDKLAELSLPPAPPSGDLAVGFGKAGPGY